MFSQSLDGVSSVDNIATIHDRNIKHIPNWMATLQLCSEITNLQLCSENAAEKFLKILQKNKTLYFSWDWRWRTLFRWAHAMRSSYCVQWRVRFSYQFSYCMSIVIRYGYQLKNVCMYLLIIRAIIQKVNVWCALSRDRLTVPFFFEEPTVTLHNFLGMLKYFAASTISNDNITFQWDGATPNFANTVRSLLCDNFPQKCIWREEWNIYPPRLPH